MTGSPIRIVLIDDDPLARRWISLIVGTQDDMQVVGEADDGIAGATMTRQLAPDVVVTDIRMSPGDGIETTRRVLEVSPNTRVLALTAFASDENIFEVLRAGASGFILKTTSADELLAAIRGVAAGDALLSPAVTRRVIDRFVRGPAPGSRVLPDDVTEREREVLLAISHGLSNSEIADKLHISLATVKTHVSRLLAKLSLRERTQLVIFAYESGLVVPGQH